MRRSNSSSHIPISRSDGRNRSRSLTRTSLKNATPLRDKLQVPSFQRASSSGFKKTTFSVSGVGSKRSLSQTPTLSTTYRKTSMTPSSTRSNRSKSPNWPAPDKGVNNPKWVSQQLAKVVSFLSANPNCPEYIPKSMKPLTISTFVIIMDILLKELNPKLEINSINYKETVLQTMKMVGYPGNISNSMLKTVNTLHTWPHIISLLSWLVDLVNVIRRVEEPVVTKDIPLQKRQCVLNYVAKRHLLFNNNQNEFEADEEFKQNLVRLLNINEEEHKQLAAEVVNLEKRRDTQLKILNSQQVQNEAIKKETMELKSEIDLFNLHTDEAEGDLDSHLALAKSRREKLVLKIQQKQKEVALLKEQIKNQPCTHQEKKKIMKNIDELKHTIDLTKVQIKTQNEMNEDYEQKLTEANKKIETQVHRINNALMKLSAIEPELKVLQIKGSNFLTRQFGYTIKTLVENIEKFETKYKQELEITRAELLKIQSSISSIKREVETSKLNIQKLYEREKLLNLKIKTCCAEIEALNNKRQKEKEEFQEKIKEFKKSELALQRAKQEYNETKAMKNNTQAEFREKRALFIDFFSKLQDEVFDYLISMTTNRNEIFDALQNYLKEIELIQKNILEDLKNLDECRKHN